jgi:hypothetical protein
LVRSEPANRTKMFHVKRDLCASGCWRLPWRARHDSIGPSWFGGDHGTAANRARRFSLHHKGRGPNEPRRAFFVDRLGACRSGFGRALSVGQKARRPGLPWRCSRRSCLRLGMIFPTWRSPRRSLTGRREFRKRNSRREASAAFAALPATRKRPSAPPSCASGANLSHMGSIAASLPRSRAILSQRAPLSARARSSMPP